MELCPRISRVGALHRAAVLPSRGLIAAAAKTRSKGFGSVNKEKISSPSGQKEGGGEEKQIVREAAAAASPRPKYRPIRPEEASKGKFDYVQVADWGSGDRDKLGELRLLSHVPQYEGGESSATGGRNDGGPRPFYLQLANQLKMAEARGALAIAGPDPPPLSEWSFREGRYAQYLADQLEVHAALEAALIEAASTLPGDASAPEVTPRAASTPTSPAHGAGAIHQPLPAASASASTPQPAPEAAAASVSGSGAAGPHAALSVMPTPPPQCALRALQHLLPGRLGLERSAALRKDIAALREGHPAAVETAAAAGVVAAAGPTATAADARRKSSAGAETQAQAGQRGEGLKGALHEAPPAGPMARSYGQYLRRLGRMAASGENEEERRVGALRLLSHAAVLHMVGQAAGVRLGAMATERLALLQRRAAASYHDYPHHVKDPRVTLAAALDAAAEHIRSPALRQLVFDEMPSAMQKTGLLMTALAHRD